MDVLQHLGIDLDTVEEDFKGVKIGRTLIYDADGPCYRAAASTKSLPAAIRRFHTDLLTEMFMTQAEFATVHLTASTCDKAGRGRMLAWKPYQGQRKGKDKPSLLEPLRRALVLQENWLPNMTARLHFDKEADDGMIQEAYLLKEDGVIWSDDKDLRLTIYPYYEKEFGEVHGSESPGHIRQAYTPAGQLKILGRADKFFWCQMLMGDQADNVQGIAKLNGKLCGLAGAFTALQNIEGKSNLANFVLDGYRNSGQNILPEGWCLWLLRWPGDTFWDYVWECKPSKENAEYLIKCAKQKWRMLPGEKRDFENGKWTSEVYDE